MLDLPVGYRRFHPIDAINYQLNRWLVTADEAEFADAASRVMSLEAWKTEFLGLAAKASGEGRDLNAATYFRAAEFFMSFSDADKQPTYDSYREHFDRATADLARENVLVPFRGSHLPAAVLPAKGEKKDTVILHGGFDSYMEEFLIFAPAFTNAGYEFILFEGPGQGAALRWHGLTMDPEWEKPVGAVLDHFGIEDCTLIGISLGGYLAPRAAAFDSRIKRVVAWNMLYDFLDCFAQRSGQFAVDRMLRLIRDGQAAQVDAMLNMQMQSGDPMGWAVAHGMHISGSKTPSDYILWTQKMATRGFSDKIRQDVLILAGAEDHIVPLYQLWEQMRDLKNAASIATHTFSADDHAHNHCQVGNKDHATDVVLAWLDTQLNKKREWTRGADLQAVGFAKGLEVRP